MPFFDKKPAAKAGYNAGKTSEGKFFLWLQPQGEPEMNAGRTFLLDGGLQQWSLCTFLYCTLCLKTASTCLIYWSHKWLAGFSVSIKLGQATLPPRPWCDFHLLWCLKEWRERVSELRTWETFKLCTLHGVCCFHAALPVFVHFDFISVTANQWSCI